MVAGPQLVDTPCMVATFPVWQRPDAVAEGCRAPGVTLIGAETSERMRHV